MILSVRRPRDAMCAMCPPSRSNATTAKVRLSARLLLNVPVPTGYGVILAPPADPGECMARFRFSLERVLDYRRQQEDQAKMDLARALAAHNAQAERLGALRAKLAEHEASLYSEKQLTENDLWLWRRYRLRLNEDIDDAGRTLQELSRELTKARQRLVARAKDKKLLERLRANQELRFRQEENLKEQRESDEMATIRFRHEAV